MIRDSVADQGGMCYIITFLASKHFVAAYIPSVAFPRNHMQVIINANNILDTTHTSGGESVIVKAVVGTKYYTIIRPSVCSESRVV